MQSNDTNHMGTRPIPSLLISMAIPPILSMLVQSMYNIVDSIFVARISENAFTAVSLAYPIQNMILALAVGIGVGINSYIARNLGARKVEEANSAVVHGLIITFVHSIIFIILGIVFIKPFFRIFTNIPEIYELGCDYSYIIVLLSFGSLFHIAMEKMFQATGKMIFPMIIQAAGAIVNIILDPIMIFGMFGFPQMGVKGAAIATIIGQMTSCFLSLYILIKKNNDIKIDIENFKFNLSTIKNIYSVGLPSTIMMALPSVLVMGLNRILIGFSNAAVSVFGIYFKIQTFIYMPANGLVQGIRPIISYNYGAYNKKRIIETLKNSFLVTILIMAIGTVLFMTYPVGILGMFSASYEMIEIGVISLRIISTSFIVSSVGIIFSALFEAMGNGIKSLIISLLRQFVITLPLAVMLSKELNLLGVWITFPISEVVAAIVAIIMFIHTYKTNSIFNKVH